ncbi:alcohol dehydrogenase catalytic domain-containing protein [Phreatobacter stygius]|nr:alcohol dehydrogenase catalytic domain-containing protein [Phreatobacter stygius]
MQSLWFVRQGHLEWRDVAAPRLGGDLEALVQPIAASTCDIDRLIISQPSPFKDPFAIGHNGVGRVLEVGEGVRTVTPGDLVAISWHISCGQCDRCRRGLLAHCRQTAPGTCYGLPGRESWGGLFDDVVRVPFADAMLHRLPGGVDPVAFVATSDNLTLGYATVAPHIKAGRDRILVLGWGINGLYVVAFARALGARSLTYVDDDTANRETATELGATAFPGPPDRGMGPFDLVVDASADPKWLRGVMRLIEPESMVECVAHLGDVTLPGWQWYGTGATLHCGLCSCTGPHVHETFKAVGSGAVVPSKLWSERVAWDQDLPAAMVAHRRQLVAVRSET